MGAEYTAKSFKSGNSVAIRIPAALGVEPDKEWTVARDSQGDIVIKAKGNSARIDLSEIYGSKPGLKPLTPADRALAGGNVDWLGKRLKSA